MASSENTADQNAGMQHQGSSMQTSSSGSEKNQTNTAAVNKRYEDTHFVDSTKSVWNYSLLTEEVIRNFQQGTCTMPTSFSATNRLKYWTHPGTYFAVWAPNATMVTVIG